MATTSFTRLREMLAKADGFHLSSTTTSGGSSNTYIDTDLPQYDEPRLIDLWALATSGDNDGEARRNSSLSSDTMTVTDAYTNTVATAVTYELFPYHPTFYLDAIQEAIRTLSARKLMHRKVVDETLIVDNLLTNPLFADFAASVFTGWTHTVGTWTQETSRVWHGSQAATTNASGAASQLTQNIYSSVNINEIVGKTLHVIAANFTAAAPAARLRVTFDGGSSFTNGTYHGGSDEWEGPPLQFITVTVPSDPTSLTVYCEVADTFTGVFGLCAAWIDRVVNYTVPTSFYPYGPNFVYQQDDRNRPLGNYSRIGIRNGYRPGHILRLEGPGRLSVPTTEAGTTEIDETQAELVIAQAGVYLHRTLQWADPDNEEAHTRRMDTWQSEFNGLVGTSRMTPMNAEANNYWRVSDDNRVLRLQR
ncbi:MAG: hypothetical protein J3T61_00815 [Candidatus Brocadiales bacterium]|nr:hypothetical protein [Candidatus Bathyanammoxibius sp.]